MNYGIFIKTSISISPEYYRRFKECSLILGVDEEKLLSVLCYKAGTVITHKVSSLKAVEYQERACIYDIQPVRFFAADHEFMHANRLSSKVSVSKLIALAIQMFIDEIMEQGINPMEIAHLRVIQNSYNKKTYYLRNFTAKIIKCDEFEEYQMKMRYDKT
jgi:hypothetical protein